MQTQHSQQHYTQACTPSADTLLCLTASSCHLPAPQPLVITLQKHAVTLARQISHFVFCQKHVGYAIDNRKPPACLWAYQGTLLQAHLHTETAAVKAISTSPA